jgi:lipopolysaccharide transport system ATP-binding protein
MGMTQKEVRRKFDEIVAFAELEEFIDTPIKRYSSGMHVRLGFAVAAHLDPEILLVDEVLAVGDAAFQRKCLGKMGAAAQEGRTVVFVSHNMAAVSNLCEKVIFLSQGVIQKIGDANEVIADYMKVPKFAGSRENLIDHPNREQGREQLLSRFAMELENGVAYYGKPLTLRIGFNFPRKITTPQFVVSIHNPSGVRAFTLHSDFQSNDIPHSLEGAGEVVCRIHSLPLLPGDYTASVRLWKPGEKLDDIENVASFRVEWMERGIGQLRWNSLMGMVYVQANWELSNSNVMIDKREG